MIQLEHGQLCEEFCDLPAIPAEIAELYADFETSSGDPKLMSVNPWRHCQAIGLAVSFGFSCPVFFVPKHLLVTGWWRDVLRATKRWINHNIKYDAHVSTNDLSVPVPKHIELIDTVNDAKILNSDMGFSGGYGLDNLSDKWLKESMAKSCGSLLPYLRDSKDYGDVALDVLAEYACVDVIQNKRLHKYITDQMPEESRWTQGNEHRMTRLLYDMEQRGVHVNPVDVKKKHMEVLIKMVALDARIDRFCGRSFTVASNKDCYDVLVNQYGLPVLAWTEPDPETGGVPGPSFDKHALKLYLNHPEAPTELIQMILDYRKLSTFRGLFLDKWDELNVDGVVHATYNQSVRTGRMSCSDPNLQQLDVQAKELIIPPEGYAIVVCDASQIEYRYMVHYVQSKTWIDAYAKDPWTDAHTLVASRGSIVRSAGKTLNFAIGFGQGERATIAQMAIDKEFVGDVVAGLDLEGMREEARLATIRMACEQKARAINQWYHTELLPELKPMRKAAERAARERGWVRNHAGRRRYLPPDFARLAFPNLCQSSAGDFVKERMVALDREVPELLQVAQVHDEVVGYVPLDVIERDEREFGERVVSVLNDPDRPLSVPLRWTFGWSKESWAHAKSKEMERKLF